MASPPAESEDLPVAARAGPVVASVADSDGPPGRLVAAVALVALATLMVEILVTRLSSVLFFYHFSFFSISLVMSGLVLGGLLSARWNAASAMESFTKRLGVLASLLAAGVLLPILVVVRLIPAAGAPPSVLLVAMYSLCFLPGLVAAGAFLALAFSRRERWIGPLYGSDLFGAAAGCVLSIVALRHMQGPAAFMIPAFMAAVAALILDRSGPTRLVAIGLGISALALAALSLRPTANVLRLRAGQGPKPVFERWNEHSRIVAYDLLGIARALVIDRTAGTVMLRIPPKPDGKPVDIDISWRRGSQYAVYHLPRPVHRSAIIGVGGGLDLLAALSFGASAVHGYELNQTFIDLFQRDFKDFNAIASRPELKLIHTEARVGITHSGQKYDVIQASLIDTWAATASGGFVLSENNLYTREAWRTFFDHLTDTGVLTMTRWYIATAPAETLRLVSLAATALEDAGFPDASHHLVLLRSNKGSDSFLGTIEMTGTATLLASKAPFTTAEIDALRVWCETDNSEILVAPGVRTENPALRGLLSSRTRAETIRANRFDISPPSDERPYFFLQIRPTDLVNLFRRDFGEVTQITFNGVRVLLILCACALAFVVAIALVTLRSSPGAGLSREKLRAYRLMIAYFLGIGAGYILIQLGLHQRLIVVLGHPTLALSVVLFSMLLGTGVGAILSRTLIRSGRSSRAAIVATSTVALVLAFERFTPLLERFDSQSHRIVASGTIVALVGCALGVAFPIGVRTISGLGDKAVQHAWAMNGAASIAASAFSALVGITWGSTGVLALGTVLYVSAAVAAALSESAAGSLARSEVSLTIR